MIRKPLAIAACTTLLAVASLAACQREAAAPAPDTIASPATVAPAAPATVAAAMPDDTTQHVDFDSKAFAGTYAAPGTTLHVTADGNYRMSVHAQSAGADLETSGTWTADADARHVLLDPNSKSEADQRFEIVSHDELRSEDGSRILHRSAGM